LSLLRTAIGGLDLASFPAGPPAVLGPVDAFLFPNPAINDGPFWVTNSADSSSAGTVSPGQLLSLFGKEIGPENGVLGKVVNGAFTDTLAGFQVFLAGRPAPMLYAGRNQLNVVVPQSIGLISQSGRVRPTVPLSVVGPMGTVDFPALFVAGARPRVFVSTELSEAGVAFAAAVNSDGTINSATRPAEAGSVVAIWASGLGFQGGSDGMIMTSPTFAPPVSVLSAGGYSLEVTYSSFAPNMVLGIRQINFRLPATGVGLVALQTSYGISPLVAIHVQKTSQVGRE